MDPLCLTVASQMFLGCHKQSIKRIDIPLFDLMDVPFSDHGQWPALFPMICLFKVHLTNVHLYIYEPAQLNHASTGKQ